MKDHMQNEGDTEYFVLRNEEAGLDGVIALHSTALGPGAGGCRFWHYSSRNEMLVDAARLARGMTYKNALAELPLGGAKAVLRVPDEPFDRAQLFRAFGREVAKLRGRYFTAEDVGTCVADMESIALETVHVAGLPQVSGKPGGDPSPWTARGVLAAMDNLAREHLARPLSDCTVAIQGVGNVGGALAKLLHSRGAKLVLADTNSDRVAKLAAETGAVVADVNEICGVEADILAPCALGGVFDAITVAKVKAKVVCGAANNQLVTEKDGVRLAERGILYAPDCVVNAGGIINVAAEHLGWDNQEVVRRVDGTAERLARVLARAEQSGQAPNLAADSLARERVRLGGALVA
ncbi:Glu/Leu/Phe/Val dehydrogenase [Erythrobacter sp. AP23]|uniref:Glu/Leu/Phe/Val family dehydrogenase n=1 Tax=Erythrobacter sp. AP23 TaxID=499656 RepID=UPI00076D3E35|nr:Glu/Leu/Phe/Val dehydrogenase dimerization domain-containing protein [Erythrobacter sp. AP23]KWV95514.1 amino acid dehydrogenase [Erythrobacter sp. AP23]